VRIKAFMDEFKPELFETCSSFVSSVPPVQESPMALADPVAHIGQAIVEHTNWLVPPHFGPVEACYTARRERRCPGLIDGRVVSGPHVDGARCFSQQRSVDA